MESKIEKLVIYYDEILGKDRDVRILDMANKIDEIIDHLNSQAQPEEKEVNEMYDFNERTITTYIVDEDKVITILRQEEMPEWLKKGDVRVLKDTPEEWSWKFLKGGCEPTDYSKQPKMEEELHDKLLEIWCGLLPTPSKASFDPEPIRIRIEGTEKYVKQLLDEREREVRKSVLKEVREWLFSYLDKLNKEEK